MTPTSRPERVPTERPTGLSRSCVQAVISADRRSLVPWTLQERPAKPAHQANTRPPAGLQNDFSSDERESACKPGVLLNGHPDLVVGDSAGAVRRAVAAGRAVQAMCRGAVVRAAEMRVPAIVVTFLRPASRRWSWRRFGSMSWRPQASVAKGRARTRWRAQRARVASPRLRPRVRGSRIRVAAPWPGRVRSSRREGRSASRGRGR